MRIWTPLCVFAVVSLNACAQMPMTGETPLIRLPMGVVYGISDALCEDVKNTLIPNRLEELEIPFEWTDEVEGLLTVGPVMEGVEGVYSRIRQTYYLQIICDDELTTRFKGEATLEGLNANDEWIVITDAPTIEQYAMQFLESLDL